MNDETKGRNLIVAAALLALFLGALDTLVMSAAMPTIVAELGGLSLYSWVFSVYLLCRAVSLPVFGKLSDLFDTKKLFMIAIVIFLISSIWAGMSNSITQLIASRALQGIGSGGIFALVYIVLSDISSPEERGRMMSLASFVWGVASVLGPSVGGFIVNYFSWRWVFFINIPLGGISFVGIYLYFTETRKKRKEVSIDILGLATLSLATLALLTGFLLAGEGRSWFSPEVMGLFLLTAAAGTAFYHVEKRVKEPVIPMGFFSVKGFRTGTVAIFFCSFTIFGLMAFSPLFIQGALGKTPAELGIAMLSLSLAWSLGALVCGYVVRRVGSRAAALVGGLFLLAGCGMTLSFSVSTPLLTCFAALSLAGFGMGAVSIPTLLTVQDSLEPEDMGIATASHQFSRTLAGTIGVGISGSLVSTRITGAVNTLISSNATSGISAEGLQRVTQDIENLLRPEFQTSLPAEVLNLLHEMVAQGVMAVFVMSTVTAIVCFAFCCWLPAPKK